MPAKKKIKVQDLKPKKDAKGGVILGPHQDNPRQLNPRGLNPHGNNPHNLTPKNN